MKERYLQESLKLSVLPESSLAVCRCDYNTARVAVMNWHYSECMPKGRLRLFGVYENNSFIGAVIFASSISPHTGKRFGLAQTQVLELARVALGYHQSPVSEIVTMAVKLLKREEPDLRLLVSYADPEQNHCGTIYQAMNWKYDGLTEPDYAYELDGRIMHPRTVVHKYGTRAGLEQHRIPKSGKHRYYLPLSRDLKKSIKHVTSYPKHTESTQ